MKWSDGSVYAGAWSEGQINGSGVMYYANGTKYAGEWSKGQMHGKGEVTYSDGRKQFGIWNANQLVKVLTRAKKTDKSENISPRGSSGSTSQLNSAATISASSPSQPINSSIKVSRQRPSRAPELTENRPFDILSPHVEMTYPAESLEIVETDRKTVIISGRTSDTSGIHKITLDDNRVDLGEKGYFEVEVALEMGANHFVLMVIDRAYNATEIPILIHRIAPVSEEDSQN